jgi:hypothetical protein
MKTLLAVLLPALGAGLASTPAPVAAADVKPICASASHQVLKVQEGRDVCAPTVLANGKAVSVGFLPTTCPPQAPELVVDAVGLQDLCRPRGGASRHDAPGRG